MTLPPESLQTPHTLRSNYLSNQSLDKYGTNGSQSHPILYDSIEKNTKFFKRDAGFEAINPFSTNNPYSTCHWIYILIEKTPLLMWLRYKIQNYKINLGCKEGSLTCMQTN
jgi:hypothetical protein